MNFASTTDLPISPERRSEKRYKAFLPITLDKQTQNDFAMIFNLSNNGLGIRSDHPINTGEQINVFLNNIEQDRIKIKVNVLCCREKNGDYFIRSNIVSINEKDSGFYKKMVNLHKPEIIK